MGSKDASGPETSLNSSIRVTVGMFILRTISTALVLQGVTSSRRVPTKKPLRAGVSSKVAPPKSQVRRSRASAAKGAVLSTT